MANSSIATPTYTASGSKAATPAKLSKDVFGVEVANHQLIRQAYDTYLSNGRINLAVTKTRGLISGGGRKPWKQKGTGRARFGSSRNPIWRGGGIVFGPTGEENYTKKLPTSSKRLATRQALSLANAAEKIVVIEKLASREGKTSEIVKLLAKVGAKRTVLIVVTEKTPELIRAVSNLSDVKLVAATYVNVYDIMNADTIVVTGDAQKAIEAWLGGAK
ncbi:MAG: 50S ribosomal protein L4 [Candidatus Saccharibacteria bacterium]